MLVFFKLTYQHRSHQIVKIRPAETYCHWWRGPNYSAVFKHFKKNTNIITDVKVLYPYAYCMYVHTHGELWKLKRSIVHLLFFLSILMTTIEDVCQKHMLIQKFINQHLQIFLFNISYLLEIKAFGISFYCYKTISSKNTIFYINLPEYITSNSRNKSRMDVLCPNMLTKST